MSNADILRSAYDAFASGDIPQVLATFDDDIEWIEAAGYIYAGTYTGIDDIVQNVFTRLGSEWDAFLVEPDTFICEGDQVAALGWLSGTYKATGIAFRARFVHWWTMTDGRASRMESILDSVKLAEAVSPQPTRSQSS
jgi:ketosteroid isomerase-like protein